MYNNSFVPQKIHEKRETYKEKQLRAGRRCGTPISGTFFFSISAL